jgi:hypothetical protein
VKAADIQLGMRVKRRSHEGSFVKDRTSNPDLKGRRVGIVIGLPEELSTRHRAVRIQFEGSTRSELILLHRLEALPAAEQPVALGGKWKADDTTFLNARPAAV